VLTKQVRKRHFCAILIVKCIILPRHARDKHRESTHKRMAFSYRKRQCTNVPVTSSQHCNEPSRPPDPSASHPPVRKTASFFEFSLCLSRACLGKMFVFLYKWLRNAVFRRRPDRPRGEAAPRGAAAAGSDNVGCRHAAGGCDCDGAEPCLFLCAILYEDLNPEYLPRQARDKNASYRNS
jgi:hypothetical protein